MNVRVHERTGEQGYRERKHVHEHSRVGVGALGAAAREAPAEASGYLQYSVAGIGHEQAGGGPCRPLHPREPGSRMAREARLDQPPGAVHEHPAFMNGAARPEDVNVNAFMNCS